MALRLTLLVLTLLSTLAAPTTPTPQPPGVLAPVRTSPTPSPAPARFIWDMVFNNPGEARTVTAFNNPTRLASWGYNGQVIEDYLQAAITYDAFDKNTFPENSPERKWVLDKAADLDKRIAAAHAAHLPVYFFTDLIILPKSLVAQHKDDLTDPRGRIDPSKPLTQKLLRIQLKEIFDRFPTVDGLVIRTGEVYTQNVPYHAGNNPILKGPDSHIQLLQILRDEVCEQRHKLLVYRTWDFVGFHTKPDYYLKVTNAIPPSPYLFFSIKHQAGDFHRMTPFNPTLTIGNHPQIVEVQCQLEAYGKGAHPYYVANGVINGWEEYAQIMPPDQPHGLKDVISNPHFAGVWTWSRGGGWEGPYITNEFWCELNAYVLAKYAQDPTRSEESIFNDFATMHGLPPADLPKFRDLCLTSAAGVLRGQLSLLDKLDPWWARDHFIAAVNLSSFRHDNLIPQALAEKAQAVAMWNHIEALSKQLHFPDPALQEFIQTSCTYGRIKYALFEQIWKIQLLGPKDPQDPTDRATLTAAIAEYDRLWQEWRTLKATSPSCATLYLDEAFRHKPGIGAAVDKYRDHTP